MICFFFFIILNQANTHNWPYLPVISYYNIAFMLEAEIHSTQLYFIIDTGSSVTMIESTYKQSQTFQNLNQTYEQQYDLGKCKGVFGMDRLVLSKQLYIPQFTMAYGTCQKMPFFDQYIGLMGLSNRFQVKHVFEDQQFHSSIFGLEFRKNKESRLYYNITNIEEKVTWHQLNVDHRWMIKMLGVYVDNEDVTDIFTGSAFLDSGYSCLVLTQNQFAYIWERNLKSLCKIIDKSIYCDCNYNNFPNFTIYFEGAKIIIESQNYFPYSYNDKLCKLCISQHNRDYLILGLPFIMSTTVLFDKTNQKIGLVDSFDIHQISPIYFHLQLIIVGTLTLVIIFYASQKERTFVKVDIELRNLEYL
ncbi:unnamed protein product [Paramecium octaurelia]|uniref:Peptidase A1 domain-containing protein n=1 Tax=Paramecium octaurelia TaxID=43137 RepID=A0A8S1V9W2_PAROT|nr:unnamed protein product [Paramecium octaurelia]